MHIKTEQQIRNDRIDRLVNNLPDTVWFTAIAQYVNGQDEAMYRRSGGRNFHQLCDLIGCTAEVELSEVEYYDGFRDHRFYWNERVTIREFHGLTHEPVYTEEGYLSHSEAHPCFVVESKSGRLYTMFAEHLQDIQPG